MDSTSSLDRKLEAEGSIHGEKPTLSASRVDVAAQLTAGKEITFTPEEAARVRYVANGPSQPRHNYVLKHSLGIGERLTCI